MEVDDGTLSRTDVVVTAGGDGTILRAVRVAAPHSVPILGVNLGRVGFMTELAVDEAADKRSPPTSRAATASRRG